MSLRNWAQNGWLKEHKTSAEEIADLLRVAERDLEDCRTPGLSADWQLGIAYNAALQAATAALAASGYRAALPRHPEPTIYDRRSCRFRHAARSIPQKTEYQ